ncbi:MAG: hypothetical protein Q8O22_05370 [Candidatus Omnitrophota bacterium]|nr:hypothetical protein [Candidatus Omnitrophota bacterium]
MRKYQNGAILLIVLIVVLTISLLGMTLVALYYNVLTTSQIELYRAQALYLAEAGIAQAISNLRKEAESPPVAAIIMNESLKQIVARTNLGGGYYEVFGNILDQVLVSTGSSHGVNRTIQLKYSAF